MFQVGGGQSRICRGGEAHFGSWLDVECDGASGHAALLSASDGAGWGVRRGGGSQGHEIFEVGILEAGECIFEYFDLGGSGGVGEWCGFRTRWWLRYRLCGWEI